MLIGIAVGGKAVGGVIHQPFWSPPGSQLDQPPVGRTVWGMVGLGVKGLQLPTTPTSSSSDQSGLRLVVTWPPYADPELLERTVVSIKPKSVVQVGGGEILMILDEKVDAYVFAGVQMQKWDTCASDAILSAAGGLMTDIYGNPMSYRDIDSPTIQLGVVKLQTILQDQIGYVDTYSIIQLLAAC